LRTGRSKALISSQPFAGPEFVLARKYRYLPPASNAGDVASASPSLSWKFLPSAREWRNTAFM